MSIFILALCCLGCGVNGVIIGWVLYDFRFREKIENKVKEASRLLDNAEKIYVRAEFVSESLKLTREKYKDIFLKYTADQKRECMRKTLKG